MKSDFSEEKEPKKSFFDRFRREPKGVSKDEKPPCENPNFVNFFKSSFRNFNRIVSVNMLYVFGNFTLIFGFLGLSGYVSIISHAPYFPIYSILRGVEYEATNPVLASLQSIFGLQSEITVNTVWTYIMYGLAALTLFTFGPVNAGATRILRSVFRGDPIFFFSDFFTTIKKNLKQSIIYGFFDALIILLLSYDIVYFVVHMNESMMNSILFYLSIVMAIFYLFMRLYIYLMMITFDLKMTKLIKNAVFFAMLGFKRNFMWFVGLVVVASLEFLIMSVFPPIAIILPFVALIGLISYLGVYCAYPKIKEVMIDPYYANKNE